MIIYALVLVVHVLVAVFLIGVILLQGGRGGLGEALGGAAAQSLFGGGANTVMTKITAVGAGLFMATSLSLAILSTARGRSVIDRLPVSPALPITLPQSDEGARAPETSPSQAGSTQPQAPPQSPAEPPLPPDPAASTPVPAEPAP